MQNQLINILLFSILLSTGLPAQNLDTSKVNKTKLTILTGVSAGAFIYAYGIQNNMWWKGEQSSFHFNWKQDWNASLGADKIGHFYFGSLVSKLYKHGFLWVGLSEKRSILYAGLFTFTYQTFLEIRDGFSKSYGFSLGDFGANLFGSMYQYFQYSYPALKNYNLKISYKPSKRFKNNSHYYIIDDYESTYHWLSIDINNLLPAAAAKVFPDIINLSIGHGVKGLGPNRSSEHEIFISLDWDLMALPGNSSLLKFLKETLNLYRLPAPAIKIYPNVVWYGIRF